MVNTRTITGNVYRHINMMEHQNIDGDQFPMLQQVCLELDVANMKQVLTEVYGHVCSL